MLCTASDDQTHSRFWHIQNCVYSGMLRHIQAYWSIAKAHSGFYSGIFSTLCNPHIYNFAIVRAIYSGVIQPYLGILRTFRNVCICRPLAYLESWNMTSNSMIGSSEHTQNPVIFTKIGKPCVTLEISNPGILAILEYSEPWHI